MIAPDHARLMARYNRWQNRSLYGAAEQLTDAARWQERGSFFGSIHGTLSHLLWGDSIWMHRFTGSQKPPGGIKDSPGAFPDWQALTAGRSTMDERIIAWADGLGDEWLGGKTSWWSGAMNREVSRPNWVLATHFFNHQTHHRGQVHAMLTAAGAKPEDTDLIFMDMAPA
ncbi:MAG: DinB family protein [Beijerinckiaceae bacterium]